MKFLVLFALIALAAAAPQPRKLFHEHIEDFVEVIAREAGDEIAHITEHYMEFEEFRATMEYLATNNFKDLVYEMESLPEFKAVLEFLEKDNIDIMYFIDLINEMLETFDAKKARNTQQRHEVSGTNYSAYINDVIVAFPKDKLAALFEEKMAEDQEFNSAIENLKSEEWQQIFSALLDNDTFQKEANVLEENGIDLRVLFNEIMAIFGQH